MRGVENLVGVFDTEQARIIGVAAKGTTDVSYFAAQDTPTVGMPVTAVTDPVTGGIGFNGQIVDMDETPDETNTADYPVGTLFISPAE